jgi:uncharacterized damage-inducible protein DinB
MTVNEAIVYNLEVSRSLLHRYLDDLTPQEYLHRPAPKANCAAWLVGHLILSERNFMAAAGVTDLPELPERFEKRFGRQEDAPGAGEFGDVALLRPLFDTHRDRLIDAVRQLSPQKLDEPLANPRPIFRTVGEQLNFAAQHVSMHAGQITIIRRSLGRPPLV